MVPTELISPAVAAQRLGVTVGTLSVWRATKRYALRYVKIGSKVAYPAAAVQEFIESRTVTPGEERPKRRAKHAHAE